MAYNTYSFLTVFLFLSFLLYTVVPKKFKWVTLLAASYIFFYISSHKLMFFFLVTTLVIYLGGLLLQKIIDGFESKKKLLEKDERKALKKKTDGQKKLVVLLMVLINVGILLLLKYFTFLKPYFGSALSALHIGFSLEPYNYVMPIGISFYTLQALSYIIDIYRGKIKADRNLGRVALFLSFFPQIVEGPIGRYDKLANQLYEGHSFDYRRVTFGLQLIIWGLFKKMVIADRADIFVKEVFDNYGDYSGLIVFAAMLLYTFQIYCEFSGCMDIVTGAAQLFGVTLEKNFNQPFFSKSVNEFWRRWHITLGAWLKDYVFYSISLSKPFAKFSKKTKSIFKGHFGKVFPTICALFFVWFFNGMWHGASWKYVLYGLYYYVIMTCGVFCEPLIKATLTKLKINSESKGYHAFQIFRTFLLVNLGMLLFRADSTAVAISMFTSMFRNVSFSALFNGSLLEPGLDGYDWAVLAVGFLIVLGVGIIKEKGINIRDTIAKQKIFVRWPVYLAAMFSVIIFGAYGANYDLVAFIYAQF